MSETFQAEIAKHAYFMWIKDGMADGRAAQHWAAAEKLMAQGKSVAAGENKPKPVAKPATPAKAAAKRGRAAAVKGRSR